LRQRRRPRLSASYIHIYISLPDGGRVQKELKAGGVRDRHYGRRALLRLGIGSSPPGTRTTLQRSRQLRKSHLHPRRAKFEEHAPPAGGPRALLPNLELPHVQEMDATTAHQGGLPPQAHPVFEDFEDTRQVSNSCCSIIVFYVGRACCHCDDDGLSHSTHAT
jgi:hypothetical protein